MGYFHEREVLTATGKRDDSGESIKAPKSVLFYQHDSGFDERATDELRAKFHEEYQAYLDSKDPVKIKEKIEAEIERLQGLLKDSEKGGKK